MKFVLHNKAYSRYLLKNTVRIKASVAVSTAVLLNVNSS